MLAQKSILLRGILRHHFHRPEAAGRHDLGCVAKLAKEFALAAFLPQWKKLETREKNEEKSRYCHSLFSSRYFRHCGDRRQDGRRVCLKQTKSYSYKKLQFLARKFKIRIIEKSTFQINLLVKIPIIPKIEF